MLSNLKAEYARKNITPYKGIMEALKCTEKTARNKLNEVYPMNHSQVSRHKKAQFLWWEQITWSAPNINPLLHLE